MNPGNVFAVILISLAVLRPTLTLGADPVEFIRKICTTCPYRPQDPKTYPRICTRFLSPFAGEISGDIGRAAVKSVELEISSIEYLKKFKPPPETSAYMVKRIQMAINCVSTTAVNHQYSVFILKGMVPKPPDMLVSAFKGRVLDIYKDMRRDMDTVQKCVASFDPPESPLKTNVVSRLQEIHERILVAKCIVYSFSQLYDV